MPGRVVLSSFLGMTSGQRGDDLPVFVLGERPRGLGPDVSQRALREREPSNHVVTRRLEDHNSIVPAGDEVERLQLRSERLERLLALVQPGRTLLDAFDPL